MSEVLEDRLCGVDDDALRGFPVGLAAIAATAVSLATWQAGGTGDPLAFKWLALGIVAMFAATVSGALPLSAAVRNLPAAGVCLFCLGAQFAALIWSPLDGPLGELGGRGLRQLMMMLAAAAVLAGALVGVRGKQGRWLLGGLLVLHVAIGLLILRRLPLPGIDVMMFQTGACQTLLEGHNPYALRFADPYPPASSAMFYGPGISVNGVLQVGFPYMPLSLLLDLPAYLLGDVRYASLFSTAGAGLLLAASSRGRAGRLAAALLLFSPAWPFVLFLGWTEPHVVLMLALTWFCYRRNYTRWLPIAFGLLLASKQYMPLLAPLGLLLLPRPWSVRQVVAFAAKALATSAIITLPFVLWNLPEFINSIVLFQIRQPYRPDALSFLVQANPSNPARWMWLPFAALLGAVLLCLGIARRKAVAFPAAVALGLVLFFALNKQAFANYYYLVMAALCCGVLAGAGVNDDAGSSSTRIRPSAARSEA